MKATQPVSDGGTRSGKLYLAFELGSAKWVLGFSVGLGQKPRVVKIAAGDLQRLEEHIAKAKRRFGLPADCPVLSCYEAGRDGFWLARYLDARGIENQVVDSSSIRVDRRKRRAKSDRLDAGELLTLLMRWDLGERKVWSVVRVPSPSQEDERQPQRELEALRSQRTRHVNRIEGMLVGQGGSLEVNGSLPEALKSLRLWDHRCVPPRLQAAILREWERWTLVDEQIRALEKEQRRSVRDDGVSQVDQVRQLLRLRGVGPGSAWLLVREIFGWRGIVNRRQLGSLVGLVSTPYSSGRRQREQGISKAGNRRVRWVMVELAWGWLRWQPGSALARWYQQRFGGGGSRQRRIGIVALARKLLIALWRWLEAQHLPEGAVVVDWQGKV